MTSSSRGPRPRHPRLTIPMTSLLQTSVATTVEPLVGKWGRAPTFEPVRFLIAGGSSSDDEPPASYRAGRLIIGHHFPTFLRVWRSRPRINVPGRDRAIALAALSPSLVLMPLASGGHDDGT